MKEHNVSNNSKDDTPQTTQFADILKKLDSIQKRLDKFEQLSQRQWTYSIGFGGIAIGTGMVTSGVALSDNILLIGGVVVLFLGFLAMMWSSKIGAAK